MFSISRKVTKMVDRNDDRWIGIEEAAGYLGVNKDIIRNWIKKKKDELDAWIKSGESSNILKKGI